jgi:small GTP-binding protein
MLDTPKANRLHIGIFGKRNAGKSSLINAITGQDIALVSNLPGTTTDPVYKTMELLPIGPVVLIDTAGMDDEGDIGELRIKKTREVMDKTDLALLIFTPDDRSINLEKEWFEELKSRKIPILGVVNKLDNMDFDYSILIREFNIPFVGVSCKQELILTN